MINTSKVSIIVPVFNVSFYLPKCIESILGQTFTDFELLLIDDGSFDGSEIICDNYAAKNPNIKVYHKKNGGVTSARKEGVRHAMGEYLYFVDSDDSVITDGLEILYNSAIANNLDISIGGLFYDYGDYLESRSSISGIFGQLDYLQLLLCNKIEVGPYCKLFRKKIFQNIHEIFNIPKEIKVGEDLLMNLHIVKFVNKVGIVQQKVYNYCQNSQSVMNTFRVTLEHERLFATCLIDTIEEFSPKVSKAIEYAKCSTCLTLLANGLVITREDKPLYACLKSYLPLFYSEIPLHLRILWMFRYQSWFIHLYAIIKKLKAR